MLDDIYKDTKLRMDKALVSLESELTKLRTGRAHPSLLNQVRVDYYGSLTQLSQVANISVEDARTLSVTPWEKNMVAPIEKAIITSNLGLNPATAGMVIRIPLPPLTEERRKDLVRIVRESAEHARVAVRNCRRDANQQAKELLKEKLISEDEERKAQTDIQKITDDYVAKIETIASEKEKVLMEV